MMQIPDGQIPDGLVRRHFKIPYHNVRRSLRLNCMHFAAPIAQFESAAT
jgi:hypothetical protein